MSVLESVIQWLYKNPQFTLDDTVQTEQLEQQAGSYSASRTPDRVVTPFIGGKLLIEDYFTINGRRFFQEETKRLSNDEFFEQFEDWVRQKNKERDYPTLGEGMHVDDIYISSPFYVFETSEEEAIYTFTIYVKYRKE